MARPFLLSNWSFLYGLEPSDPADWLTLFIQAPPSSWLRPLLVAFPRLQPLHGAQLFRSTSQLLQASRRLCLITLRPLPLAQEAIEPATQAPEQPQGFLHRSLLLMPPGGQRGHLSPGGAEVGNQWGTGFGHAPIDVRLRDLTCGCRPNQSLDSLVPSIC